MTPFIRELVRTRAGDRCEYCRLPQSGVPARFHVKHVIALQHRGTDDAENLALACNRCNAYKGPNLTAVDPETGALVNLFNPRLHHWPDHSRQSQIGFQIVGLTDVGRATVRLLNMNDPGRIQLRERLGLDLNRA
jgi:hypothetical protein